MTTRRWTKMPALLVVLLTLITGAALNAPMAQAVADAFQVRPGCQENDMNAGPSSVSRCINGTSFRTRSSLSPGCVELPPAPATYIYTGFECGGSATKLNAEFIGQARLISYLNGGQGGPVSPSIQWEMRMPTGLVQPASLRADVVRYAAASPPSSSAALRLIEVKGDWNPDYGQRAQQVAGYVNLLQSRYGMTGATVDSTISGYTDEYRVETGRCADGRQVVTTYTASVPFAGVVDLHEGPTTQCAQGPQPVPPPHNDAEEREPIADQQPSGHGFNDPTGPTFLPPPILPNPRLPEGEGDRRVTVEKLFDEDPLEACNALIAEKGVPQESADDNTVPDIYEACVAARSFKLAERAVLAMGGPEALCVFIHCGADGVRGDEPAARMGGDPHITTLDGLNYELQSVGEFTFARADRLGMNVQTRFSPSGANASVISAVAANVNGFSIELDMAGQLRIDGTRVDTATSGLVDLGLGACVFWKDSLFYVLGTAESELDRPAISWRARGTSAAIGLRVPAGLAPDLVGLVGNNNGNPTDDLRLADGTSLPATTSPAYLHGPFADSWRVTDNTSLFSYGPGESTATRTDRSFPQQILSRGDFTADQQAAATSTCTSYQVPAGPGFDDCVLDVLITGDSGFAATATDITRPSVVAGDQPVDATGTLSADFESPLANNLAALRIGHNTATTNIAGPFNGTEQYRFYVSQLPAHDRVTVDFDLLTLGDGWNDTDSIRLDLDGKQALVTTGWQSGTVSALDNGVTLRRTPVSVTLDQHSPQLTAALSGTGISRSEAQAFGLDNLRVRLNLTPPQSFPVALAAGIATTVSDGQPAAGAGILETLGSQDLYPFQVQPGSDVLLSWPASSYTTGWDLLDAGGTAVRSGRTTDGSSLLQGLSGAYRLSVHPTSDATVNRQQYSAELLLAPAPDVVDVQLPGPVRLPADTPVSGAGTLETKASVDLYRFTVDGANRAVRVDLDACIRPAYTPLLNWAVLDDKGTIVGGGRCRDGGQTVPGLRTGTYQLKVSSEDTATGPYALRLSQVGPEVTFSAQPPYATNQRTATFAFTSGTAGSTYECALDAPSYAGPFNACASGAQYTGLADGQHVLQVRATGPDGNHGPAATAGFTVDTVAPNVTLTRKPPPVSNINGPAFEFTSTKPGSTFRCGLVAQGQPDALADCPSYAVYRNLTHGSYRFAVQTTDPVGNTGYLSYDFAVDLEPPRVTLTPPANLTGTSSPTFTFTASETATFACSLVPSAQADAFSACQSPAAYTGLADGTNYRFAVRATDVVGHTGTSSVTWTPYATPPTVTLTAKPASGATSSSPSFAFTSSMPNPTYGCSLTVSTATAAYSACTSPKTYTGVTPGTYKFSVKATDPAGSWVSTSYTFTIAAGDTTAPTTPGTPAAALSTGTLGSDTDTPAKALPVTLTWAASTDNQAVSSYEVWASQNNAAFTKIATTAAAALTLALPPGTTSYRYQVRATDAAGNLSAYSTVSTALTPALDQENDSTRFTYTGTWTSSTAATASGGATVSTTTTNATATYKPPTGTRAIALVLPTGPDSGKVSVTIDGATSTAVTLDLYSATAGVRRILLTPTVTATAAHTVVLKVLGTKNTSSSGTRVSLDAIGRAS